MPRVGRMIFFFFFLASDLAAPETGLAASLGPKHELLASGPVSSRRIHPPGTNRRTGPADSGSSEKHGWYDIRLIADICSYFWALFPLTVSVPSHLYSHPFRRTSIEIASNMRSEYDGAEAKKGWV